MTGSNYFDLIDASNYFTSAAPVSAIIICCLHSAPALPTTAAALSSPSLSTTVSLPLPSTNRVSTHQIAGEEEEEEEKEEREEEEEKEKKEKENYNNNKNDNNNKNNNNNNDNKLII
ncbi:uncharacterized protein CIMG_13348 [Coccidioides immitis RS]|uniref:Uncharacterized protein n=1 Tax=Coccidioides immitis (strain RS) TaxID=246410 RepID=J3KD60_COCIM|nr:uncharacterized protein CIMG_13348 [Coccidioides immitis RS]EAS33251.3 hypothetical protein CIMG_13348 [Coccidioides immitis RS]